MATITSELDHLGAKAFAGFLVTWTPKTDPLPIPALLGTGPAKGVTSAAKPEADGSLRASFWAWYGGCLAMARLNQCIGWGNAPATSNCCRWKWRTVLSSKQRKDTSCPLASTCTST